MKRLLLVDDEPNVVLGMRRYFRAVGFAVDSALERDEAEALLCNVDYDGVIVDLCLAPGHGPSGLEIVAIARERCPRAGIVVLTALGSSETQAEALRLGADRFMQKPQALSRLHDTLSELLSADRS